MSETPTPTLEPICTAPHVFVATNAVMMEIAKLGISKDRRNETQKFKFRSIDDVYDSLCRILATNKLLILPRFVNRSIIERETKNGGVAFYVLVEGEFDLISAVDGSVRVIRTYGEAMDIGDKATNKAMSAAYKYACIIAFCIPTEGDNDADALTHEVAPKVEQKPPGRTLGHDTIVVPEGIDAEGSALLLIDQIMKKIHKAGSRADTKRIYLDNKEAILSMLSEHQRSKLMEEFSKRANELDAHVGATP